MKCIKNVQHFFNGLAEEFFNVRGVKDSTECIFQSKLLARFLQTDGQKNSIFVRVSAKRNLKPKEVLEVQGTHFVNFS